MRLEILNEAEEELNEVVFGFWLLPTVEGGRNTG
jgi:hypothetical protein